MKLVSSLFLVICLIVTVGGVAHANAKQGVVKATSLTVRASDSIESERIGSLKQGATVQIQATKGIWYEIDYQGRKGYVHSDYIQLKSTSTNPTKPSTSADIKIFINGEPLTYPISKIPMVDNSTLVPFRAIGEALGIKVEWNQAKKQVRATDQGKEVLFTLNSEDTKVNADIIQVRPSPRLFEHSTVIPLRFFSETFGADVKWNQQTKEISITRQKPVSDSTTTPGALTGVIARADTLNVRSGPSRDFNSLGKLTKGTPVEITDFSERWARIKYEGRDAYVHAFYLDLAKDGKSPYRLMTQPVVSTTGQSTTITYGKLGGFIKTSEEKFENNMTIQTEAHELTKPKERITGLSNVTVSENEKGKTLSFTVSNDFQASVSDTEGELIITVTPVIKGNILSGKKIVIDPGHGGKDPGAVANDLHESDIALDVSLRLEKKLREAGVHVIMTRDTDVYPSLGDRVKVANDSNADVFISVHANAAESKTANGTETYWNSTYAAEGSEGLAQAIHKKLIEKLHTTDRGVKQGNFQVIKQTKIPSVLLELGFVTNSSDAELMKTDEFRKKSAEAVYEGLEQYFNK